MRTSVGAVDVVASLVLVGAAIALTAWRRLGLERTMAWAATRAILQLLAVGAVLVWVLGPDRSLGWSWAWLLVMTVVAADVVRRRAPEVPGAFRLALAAFAAAAAINLTVLFGLGIFPVEGRTLVPLAGLMIGNSMQATVLGARRVVEELRDKRDEVEARLALGQDADQASRPYVRQAMRTALIPQIESTKTVGLIALPGAMTGLILAGVDPVDAVLVQVVVMFLVLAAAAVTSTVVSVGVTRRLFTADHRLQSFLVR